MREHRPFEKIVKAHIDRGTDVHTAFGRAIEEDPEAYGEYLKRQKDSTTGNVQDKGIER